MGGRRKSKLIPEAMALIQRRLKETDLEWKRRYERERRRAYRALIPKGPRRLRGPDKTLRKNAAPPEVRAALECLPGETELERKRRYHRLLVKHWRIQNPEREKTNRRANQRTPKYRAKRLEWIKNNSEKFRAAQLRYFEKHREDRIAALKKWGKDNPERIKANRKAWFEKHPGYLAKHQTKYRTLAVLATPPWMWENHGPEIDHIYYMSKKISNETGIVHHVDHIYPLAGKTSCGLHVPWNLQIIPATVNGRKRNKSPEEFNIQELQNDQT
jgi:hypothetical protein